MKNFMILSAAAILTVSGTAAAAPKAGPNSGHAVTTHKPVQIQNNISRHVTVLNHQPTVKILPQVTGGTIPHKNVVFATHQSFATNHLVFTPKHHHHHFFNWYFPTWGYSWYSPWYSWGYYPYLPFGW